METDIQCTLNDKIRCIQCGKTSRISTLIRKDGHRLPNFKNDSVYYHCPCDMNLARAFDPGDGNLIVSNPDLVEIIP